MPLDFSPLAKAIARLDEGLGRHRSDLALAGDGPLPLALLADLADAFDESALPWKVDLVDRATVNAAFGRIIDESAIPLV